MKIYTKTGDKGETGLFGGKRVPKYAKRIKAYGTVDELNASLGMLIVGLSDDQLIQFLRTVQSRLFDIGSHLAAVPDKSLNLPEIAETLTSELEVAIDNMNAHLPTLRHFLLPGSSELNARAHVCRTVCRRAERLVVELSEEEYVAPNIIIYLNRLSDYFFVLSRWLSDRNQDVEIKWIPNKVQKNK